MSNLQMIEMLCNLVEQQATVIRHLVMELEQARCLTNAEMEMVEGTRARYSEILGANEFPDNL